MAFYLTQSLHRVLQLRRNRPATVFGERRQTWAEVVVDDQHRGVAVVQ